MQKHRNLPALLLLAPFALIPQVAAESMKDDAGSDGPRCEIRVTERQGGVQLEGLALADRTLSGTYSFVVKKQGGGGTSNTMQGGDFTALPGRNSTVSSVSLSLGAGASYTAELTLTWPGGEASCQAEYPLRT